MSDAYLDDFSRMLIHDAEIDCAEHDPGMVEAAAMVLVGDTYSLRVHHDQERSHAWRRLDKGASEDELSPLIR